MKKLLPILLVLFLLASCASFKSSLRPYWVDNLPSSMDSIYYVGSGTGSTLSEAKAQAYRDVLSQMGENIGYDLYDLYYREMTSTKGIAALSSKISGEYNYSVNDIFFYYVMTTTPADTFLEARSPEYIARLNREDRIDAFLREATENYKANKDVAAAESILKAVMVSLEGEMVGEEYQPETLVQKAVEYLERLKITAVSNRRKTPSDAITFRVVRNKGLFSPVVEEATVKCDFTIIGLEEELDHSFHFARTDAYGRFVFNRTNPYMLHEGDIQVSVLLNEDLVYRLGLVASDELLAPIFAVIEETSYSRHYAYKPAVKSEQVLLAVAEYELNGNCRTKTYLEDTLKETLGGIGLEVPAITVMYVDDSTDVEQTVLYNYGDYRYVFICMSGISERAQIDEVIYSKAEGQIILLDTKSGTREEINTIHFASSGHSTTEADEKALYKVSEIISNLVLQEF